MKNPKTAGDILFAQMDVYEKLAAGTLVVEEAQAQTRALGNAVKSIQLMIEHSKASDRIKKGARALPDFDLPERRK